MDVGYIFTHTDGKIYIRRKVLGLKRVLLILLLYLGVMLKSIDSYKGYELIIVIVLSTVYFGVMEFVAVIIKINPRRSIVLEKTQIIHPWPFKIGSSVALSENPDPYISMTQKSVLFGKFTLSIDDVDIDFSGLATDVYLIAYLYYNNELKENGRFSVKDFKVFGKTALLPYVYILMVAFIAMSTSWVTHSPLGVFIGVIIFQVVGLVSQYIGQKTGICIYQNKIALTNKEIGGGILEISDIGRIEDDAIFDKNGNAMTFEGIEGLRYKRLARIIEKYL